jgi:hypothetical protein
VGRPTPPGKSTAQRADGRVDITDELRRYVLYRFKENDRERWLIDDLKPDPRSPDQEASEQHPGPMVIYRPRAEPKWLDREAFETILMSYLQ